MLWEPPLRVMKESRVERPGSLTIFVVQFDENGEVVA